MRAGEQETRHGNDRDQQDNCRNPSQRSNGFLTLAGGIVITFAKEILNLITG